MKNKKVIKIVINIYIGLLMMKLLSYLYFYNVVITLNLKIWAYELIYIKRIKLFYHFDFFSSSLLSLRLFSIMYEHDINSNTLNRKRETFYL